MSEESIVEEVLERINDCENDLSQYYGLWNEWMASYQMKYTETDKRPSGVSKNVVGETTRAVNAVSSSITRMQTSADPPFELRSAVVDEDKLYAMESKYARDLKNIQFKRKLDKGNKGMLLFGTQVWEKPYIRFPFGSESPYFEGTDFNPISLLQCRFEHSVYDMDYSDYFATVNRITDSYLRYSAGLNPEIWDMAKIEEGIKEKGVGISGTAESAIETRRARAGYTNNDKDKNNSLILWHGRLKDLDNPTILEMWEKFGRTDDIRYSDITVGILNRKHLVRLHPTPYGTWHHLYNIGHYIEVELEPLAHGVGSLGSSLQKDMNRITRYANDVAKFSMWNMFLAGRGSGLKSSNMNVFPWAAIPVDDINQIKELRPQIEGIVNGLKLNEMTREDFRGVTHATSTLQAVLTGATAPESSLAQSEALRAISVIAEINSDSVIKPYFDTMHKNYVDQNPYDSNMIRDVEFVVKCTTDKDFRPEHSKKLLELYIALTTIRGNNPIEINPEGIMKYLVRSLGVPPREILRGRSQTDKMLDVLQRIGKSPELKNELMGEQASLENPGGGITEPNGAVPTSPLQGGLGVI